MFVNFIVCVYSRAICWLFKRCNARISFKFTASRIRKPSLSKFIFCAYRSLYRFLYFELRTTRTFTVTETKDNARIVRYKLLTFTLVKSR